MRQLVNNMVTGVTKGRRKPEPDRRGLVQVTGAKLNLTVGYSHPVIMDMPAGITAATPTPTEILIKGSGSPACRPDRR